MHLFYAELVISYHNGIPMCSEIPLLAIDFCFNEDVHASMYTVRGVKRSGNCSCELWWRIYNVCAYEYINRKFFFDMSFHYFVSAKYLKLILFGIFLTNKIIN